MTTAYQSYLRQRTFGGLDGLRAFCILAVLWHHSGDDRLIPYAFSQFGFLGVDLFFVISGFLIVTLLLRERARVGEISLRNFYVRRLLRIFPLHYAILGVLTLAFGFLVTHGEAHDSFFHDLPYALTYTANWAPMTSILAITWSLAAEEQFYTVWPPLEKYASRAVIPILFGLIITSQLFQFRLVEGVMGPLGFTPNEPAMLRETTFTPILMGVWLAHMLHEERSYRILRLFLGRAMAPVVIALAILVLGLIAPADLTGWPRLTLHVLMTALVGSCVINETHFLMPLLRFPLLVRIGVLSYGMYLTHMLVLHVVNTLCERLHLDIPLFVFITYTALTVLVAQVSFRYFETPFLDLKSRFTR